MTMCVCVFVNWCLNRFHERFRKYGMDNGRQDHGIQGQGVYCPYLSILCSLGCTIVTSNHPPFRQFVH